MAKTVLVTGATGLLGRQVVKAFQRADWEAVGIGFTRATPKFLKVDLTSEDEIAKALDSIKPDVVVHCAANRFPDKCDADPVGTRVLNTNATHTLAHLCAAQSIFLIFISTDYVFAGRPGEAPYEAHAVPQPTNLYGETKLAGEQTALETYKTAGKDGWAVVLRVPVLYGHSETPGESAVNGLMEAVWKAQEKTDKAVEMDHWALRHPTNTEDVARVCKDIAVKYLSTESKAALPSILQFSSEDRFTKYEICQFFAEIQGLSLANMKPVTPKQDKENVATAKRPYDCHLSTKALRDIGICVNTQDFRGWWRWECRAVRM